MPAAMNLLGKKFGRLHVVARAGSRTGRATWLCLCKCGNTPEVVSHALTSGHTKSCGCWKQERNISTPKKHGHATRNGLSSTYRTWQAMWTRCTNPSEQRTYKNYGGRGISVCKRWKKFENFLADMGVKPVGLTIERKNSNGNYTPSNCKWATRLEQARNKRNSKLGDEVDVPKELKGNSTCT